MADRVVVVPSLRFAHRIVRVHARLEVPATRGGEPAVTPAIRVLVADAAAAIDAALRERPDVCLLDIRMPGDGIHAAEAIARELPETAVVMLTVSRTDSDLFRALRAGASGYLLKDVDPARLPLALRGVLDEQKRGSGDSLRWGRSALRA